MLSETKHFFSKEKLMKRFNLFAVVVSLVLLGNLVGCASSGQKIIGSNVVGDTQIVTVSAWDNDPMATNAKTLTTLTLPAPSPKQEAPCAHKPQASPCQAKCAPEEPQTGRYVWVEEPAPAPRPQRQHEWAANRHPAEPPTIIYRERERVAEERQVRQEPVAMRPAPCAPKPPVELTTKVVNSNNVGGDGTVNNFFKGGFAGLAQGAGIAGAGCLLSHAAGGSAKAVSNSTAVAEAAASSD
jgi:hypothetical protein